MKKSMRKPIMAAVMAAAMMLTACGSKTAETTAAEKTTAGTTAEQTTAAPTTAAQKEKAKKQEIVIANNVDIKSMDPQNQSDVSSAMLIKHLYNRLLSIKDDGTIETDLAESYEMVDEKTYHFKLKEGVKFHDGTPMTAQDVKFTLERAKEMPSSASAASHIAEIITDGDYDVTVKLTAPYPAILYILGNMNMSIVSEKAVTAAGDDYGAEPIGTGPFKYVEWVPNDHWTIERNEDYFGEKALAKRLICRVVPEAGSRCIALEVGEADIALRISETDAPNVEENPKLKCYGEVGSSIEFIGMNCEKEYFKDERVRQAVNYAIDKQSIVDTILEGRGEVANTYFGKTIPSWDETQTAYPYDPEKAKELLAEAGYADGFSVSICVNGDVRNRTAQIVQAQLADVGITVDINSLEWGAYLDMLQTGEMDMFILGWTNSSIDPDRSVSTLFPSDQAGSKGNNYTFLKDKELDKQIADAAIETDHEKRMQMYKDIQARLKELSPWVPLYYQQMLGGINADLKGFEYDKNMNYYFGNCHYEY